MKNDPGSRNGESASPERQLSHRGWELGTLWCPNARAGSGNGWSFPPAVEKRLMADTAGCTVLHLFGGRSRFGTRLDTDSIVSPDVIGDAWLPPFRRESFDYVILDPPYFHLNAQVKNALFRAAGWIARRQVIWFSTFWNANSGGLRLQRAYLVRVGDSCHVRCLQYFDVISRPGPVSRFNRGPAMKYNRWLSNPACLDFGPTTLKSSVPPVAAQTEKEKSREPRIPQRLA